MRVWTVPRWKNEEKCDEKVTITNLLAITLISRYARDTGGEHIAIFSHIIEAMESCFIRSHFNTRTNYFLRVSFFYQIKRLFCRETDFETQYRVTLCYTLSSKLV